MGNLEEVGRDRLEHDSCGHCRYVPIVDLGDRVDRERLEVVRKAVSLVVRASQNLHGVHPRLLSMPDLVLRARAAQH